MINHDIRTLILLFHNVRLIAAGIVLLVIAAIALIYYYIWFLCVTIGEQQDELREGHETENWVTKQKESSAKVKKIGYVLLCVGNRQLASNNFAKNPRKNLDRRQLLGCLFPTSNFDGDVNDLSPARPYSVRDCAVSNPL